MTNVEENTVMKKLIMIVGCVLFAGASWSQTLREPSDTELRATYCVSVRYMGGELIHQQARDAKIPVSEDVWKELERHPTVDLES
jgi:hypothetical protein